MRVRGSVALGALCAMTLAVSACGDDAADAGGSDSGPIKVGIITPISGNSGGTFGSAVGGADARLKAYEEEGGTCAGRGFELVEADDVSSAQGALTAAQKLVQQDKVFALLETSPFFYGASQFATTAGKAVPVFGGGFDGAPEWNRTDHNLFSVIPSPNWDKTYSTAGDYAKAKGGTRVAGIAYDSPSSQKGMQATLRSTDAAGLARGYVNDSIPFGTTDVGAIVLGIIESKADVIQLGVNPETSFGIVAGLKQANYPVKALISATGYGADLLESAPAVQAAQGLTFTAAWKPTEMKTPETELMAQALKTHASSESGIPGFAQAMGWFTADLFLHSLELSGCDAGQEQLIKDLRQDKTWDGNGLLPAARDFSTTESTQSCSYFVVLEGKGFVPEPDAAPLCGGLVG